MGNIKTSKVTFLKGAVGNTEWWTEHDWEEHRKNVMELKAIGEYLKPVEITVSWTDFPESFNITKKDPSLVSYGYGLIDTSDYYPSRMIYLNKKEDEE